MKLETVYTHHSGFSRDGIASGAIRIATRGDHSHVLALFTLTLQELDDALEDGIIPAAAYPFIKPWPGNEFQIYYESHWHKDPRTGKSGVRGPYDYRKLTSWHAEDSKHHHITHCSLPFMTQAETRLALLIASAAVGIKRYAKTQIASNLLGFAIGRGIPHYRRSRDRWTCSETIARLLPARIQMNALDAGYLLFDEIAPSSRKRAGLKELLAAYARDRGPISADPSHGRP